MDIQIEGKLPIEDKPKSAMSSPWMKGQSPRPASIKSVSIYGSDSISPLIRGGYKEYDSDQDPYFHLDRPFRLQRRSSLSHKLGSRPSIERFQRGEPLRETPAGLMKIAFPFHRDAAAASYMSTTTTNNHGTIDLENNSAIDGGTSSSHRYRQHMTIPELLRWVQKQKARRKTLKSRSRPDRDQAKPQSQQEHHHRFHLPHHLNLLQNENQTSSASTQHSSPSDVAPTLVNTDSAEGHTSRRGSDASSNGSAALDTIHELLNHWSNSGKSLPYGFPKSRRSRSFKSLRRPKRPSLTSSDTELLDGDLGIPSCDVVLDNPITFHSNAPSGPETHPYRKILELAHTLRLRGWRSVPLSNPEQIIVERLSGALTNSVYVVSPPQTLPSAAAQQDSEHDQTKKKSVAKKLLLRIYGSQVDHLIDRASELQILRRLAKQRIGPRLLGTFQNGRFEEFLDAETLKAKELRVSETSRQIAKRMRELHDGIKLLDQEVEAGPFVLQNIRKWMPRAEKIVKHLEQGIRNGNPMFDSLSVREKFVVSSFDLFKKAVSKYEAWLHDFYSEQDEDIQERLVFTHNDAQSGNILRLLPTQNPSLLPAHQHKRLVVIDFEYANANVPGLDIANHFTEWCYNYNDKSKPFACRVEMYPTQNEQINFLRSYVTHQPALQPNSSSRPGFPQSRPSSIYSAASSYANTPAMLPLSVNDYDSSTSNLAESRLPGPALLNPLSMRDMRASTFPIPRSQPVNMQQQQQLHQQLQQYHHQQQLNAQQLMSEEDSESVRQQINLLMWEIRIWRGLNSAQWVLWGLVQAEIPGLVDINEENDEVIVNGLNVAEHEGEVKKEYEKDNEKEKPNVDKNQDEHKGFDYLSYAQDRARFFFGDVQALRIMHPEDLPSGVVDLARLPKHERDGNIGRM